MQEAIEIFLGAIDTMAYDSKLELRLLLSYCDLNIEDCELKDVLLKSIDRIDGKLYEICSAIEKFKANFENEDLV